MKRNLLRNAGQAACLLLAACAGLAASASMPEADEVYEEPVYVFEQTRAQEEYPAGGGTVGARYSCQLLMLTVSNQDRLSPEDGTAAAQAAENFNSKMHSLMIDAVGAGKTMSELAEEVESAAGAYYDETEAGYVQNGQIVSVRVDNISYTGGAHPNSHAFSYLFDMEKGTFVDPSEIADDPELLRATVTDLILDQINGMDQEMRDGLFENYPSVVSQWNNHCVELREEGLLVTFSAYDIGPYAMGALGFDIPYTSITGALGEGGADRLLGAPAEK